MKKPPGDYDVGYGRPPDATKFGRRPQPLHRQKRKPYIPDVLSLLNGHADVMQDGRHTRLHPHEAMMLSLGKRSLKREIRAIKLFLGECKKAGLLAPPSGKRGGVAVCPKWMPVQMFMLIGEAPWSVKEYDRIAAQFEAELKMYDEFFPGAREKAEHEHKIK